MTRDLRFKISGILFYSIIVLNILFSQNGPVLLKRCLADPNAKDLSIGAIITFGIAVFTSEGIGYVFSSLHMFWFNFLRPFFKGSKSRGFSYEWESLTFTTKNKINAEAGRSFDNDVLISYFWQQAPDNIREWVTRRYLSYFIGIPATIAIVIGEIACLVFQNILVPTTHNYIIMALALALSVILWKISHLARKEAKSMVELHLSSLCDEQLSAALKKYPDNQAMQLTGKAGG